MTATVHPIREARREPPHNLDLEQQTLGALLCNNQVLPHVGFLRPDHFHEPLHARIFEAAAGMIRAGKLASPVTLATYFAADEAMIEIGGTSYLARLAANAATVLNAPNYAGVVRDLAMLRRLAEVGEEIAGMAMEAEPGVEPGTIIENARAELATLTLEDAGQQIDSLGGAAIDMLEALDETVQTRGTFGLRDLDRKTGGLFAGDFVLIAGRPGMGKTIAGLHAALSSARAGHTTALFSLEMPKAQISQRAVSALSWGRDSRIPYSRFRGRHDFTPLEMERLAEAARDLKALPIYIADSSSGLTGERLRGRVEWLKHWLAARDKTLSLVVVDYLGLMSPGERYRGSKVNEVGEISAALKRMALDLGIAVVALHQLSRQVESRDDKRPQLSDLRDSGNLEQDADVAIFLHREEYYLDRALKHGTDADAKAKAEERLAQARNKIDFGVAKNRHGPTGDIAAFCDVACSIVRDLENYR